MSAFLYRQGEVAAQTTNYDPPGRRGKTEKRPHSVYGPRGMSVIMRPIKGVTAKGVFEDEKPFKFQTSPIETFAEDGTFQWNDYNTVGAGQHSTALGRSLQTIQFDTVFVDWQPHWTLIHDSNWHPNPRKMVDELKAIRDSGKAFLLLATQADQSGYDVNYPATLRTVHWELRAGEVDAYYVTVSFTEFVSPDIKKYIAASASSKLPASLPIAQVMASSATLASLAKQFYGDPTKANVIAAANGLPKLPHNDLITEARSGLKKILIPRLASKPTAGIRVAGF